MHNAPATSARVITVTPASAQAPPTASVPRFSARA